MNNTYTAKAEETINASMEKVWTAFTDPKMVKEWLFGTEMVISKWEVGEQIRYKGSWEGKAYEDKGEIVEFIPGQKIVSTYWSSMSGTKDEPENYQRVTYELSPEGDSTHVVITQEGSKTEETAKHAENNWKQVLATMKKLLE